MSLAVTSRWSNTKGNNLSIRSGSGGCGGGGLCQFFDASTILLWSRIWCHTLGFVCLVAMNACTRKSLHHPGPVGASAVGNGLEMECGRVVGFGV